MSDKVAGGRPPGPLRTGAIRRAVVAPELERYLSMQGVDFAMTDQVEALLVRVRRGIEVLERRLAEGLRVARKWNLTWAITAGFTASASLCLIGYPLAATATALVFAVAMLLLVQGMMDTMRLRALRGRYTGLIDLARSREQIIEYAARALADATALGAVPANVEESPPPAPRNR